MTNLVELVESGLWRGKKRSKRLERYDPHQWGQEILTKIEILISRPYFPEVGSVY